MLREIHNSLVQSAAVAMRSRMRGTVRICFYGLYTLCTTCDAATLAPQAALNSTSVSGTPRAGAPASERHQQLSEVWREAFPSPDDVMAPSSSAYGFSPSKSTAPWAGVRRRAERPHPAVARIVVPEEGAISYGSGTLIDVRENFGLVITNWHVVRDATGTIEVVFPNGFTSKARALKVDSDWDLAALVVWQPRAIEPVSIAATAPRPGDRLTICGYGQGDYRCATGRCTQYYAPRQDFPRHMVELDVQARQGDSGGPIFNERGELAGVLFGAGQGTTLGSFGGRVGAFLATLAPDIGRAEQSLAQNPQPEQPQAEKCPSDQVCESPGRQRSATLAPHRPNAPREFAESDRVESERAAWPADFASAQTEPEHGAPPLQVASLAPSIAPPWQTVSGRATVFEQVKTALAAVGFVTVIVQVMRVAR